MSERTPPPPNSIYIHPGDYKISNQELRALMNSLKKGSSSEETKSAIVTLMKDNGWMPRMPMRPGPKKEDPPDKNRHRRQHYLWLLRELLDQPEDTWTDAEVCRKAALAIYNFDDYCQRGIFISEGSVSRIRKNLRKVNLSPINEADTGFLAAFYPLNVSSYFKRGVLGILDGSVTNEQEETVNDPGALINVVLCTLLETGSETFRIFDSERLRTSNAGRPTTSTEKGKFIIAGIKSECSFWSTPSEHQASILRSLADKPHQPQAPKKMGQLLHPDVSGLPPANRSKPKGIDVGPNTKFKNEEGNRPPATEEEILRKTCARLMLAKNLLRSRRYLKLSATVCGLISDHQKRGPGEEQIYSELIIEIINTIWESAQVQVSAPWEHPNPNEMVAYNDSILPLGVLEVKI